VSDACGGRKGLGASVFVWVGKLVRQQTLGRFGCGWKVEGQIPCLSTMETV
jgi:hypothetical protein